MESDLGKCKINVEYPNMADATDSKDNTNISNDKQMT